MADNTGAAVKRVQKMEKLFDKAKAAESKLRKAAGEYEKLLSDIGKLREYYTGQDWKNDFQADEEGGFPSELKRGVLSEDGIWNFLEDSRELAEELKELSEKMIV